MNDLTDYADVEEAAELLNIHPESARRLARQGKLPAIRVFNKWLIDRNELAQYAHGYKLFVNGKPTKEAQQKAPHSPPLHSGGD